MREGVNDPRVEAEGELALARLALDTGDFTHAAAHLAGAYAQCPPEPALAEAHTVLAQLYGRTGGTLIDLFPIGKPAFIGTLIARAYALALLGDRIGALSLFLAASRHEPARPWARVPWLDDDGFAASLDPDELWLSTFRLCNAVSDRPDADVRAAILPYMRLVRRAIRINAGHGMLAGAASALARRLGEPDEAIVLAQRAVRMSPTMMTEMWLAYALRAAGRPIDALEALRRAIAHDPSNMELHVDIASVLTDLGRLDEAIRGLEDVLRVSPKHDCTVHTLARLRFTRDENVAHLVELADFVRTEPPTTACQHTDLERACHGTVWLGHVAPPVGAVQGAPDAGRTASAVATVAAYDLPHPPGAYDNAITLAGLPIDELVGCLEHPVGDTDRWRRCVQVAAGLGLLHQYADEPWLVSRRRDALVEIVGRDDPRTVEAAMFALVVAAWVDPSARTDVAQIVTDRFAITGTPQIAALVRATPEITLQVRARARHVLRRADTPEPPLDPAVRGRRSRMVRAMEWPRRRRLL